MSCASSSARFRRRLDLPWWGAAPRCSPQSLLPFRRNAHCGTCFPRALCLRLPDTTPPSAVSAVWRSPGVLQDRRRDMRVQSTRPRAASPKRESSSVPPLCVNARWSAYGASPVTPRSASQVPAHRAPSGAQAAPSPGTRPLSLVVTAAPDAPRSARAEGSRRSSSTRHRRHPHQVRSPERRRTAGSSDRCRHGRDHPDRTRLYPQQRMPPSVMMAWALVACRDAGDAVDATG